MPRLVPDVLSDRKHRIAVLTVFLGHAKTHFRIPGGAGPAHPNHQCPNQPTAPQARVGLQVQGHPIVVGFEMA